jgi:hypothetical protein
MSLEIRTAAEMIALDLEGRQAARRAVRETGLMQWVLRAFVERAEPVHVDEIVAAFPDRSPSSVFDAVTSLDDEDLVQIRAGRVDIAYPFSASPTPFVVDLGKEGQRYACCAIDALGLAPMLGRPLRIRSRCHHCGAALELSVDPSGPGREAAGVMVWVGKRVEDGRRACDSL